MEELAKSIRVGTVDFFGIVVPGFVAIFILVIGFILPMTSVIESTVSGRTIDWGELSSGSSTLDIAIVVVGSYVLGYILRLSSPDDLDRISAEKVLKEERDRFIRKIILDENNKYWEEKKERIPVDESNQKKPSKELRWERASKTTLKFLLIRKFPIWFLKFFFGRVFKSCKDMDSKCEKFMEDDCWPYDPLNSIDKYPYFGFKDYLRTRGHTQLAASIVTWDGEENGKKRSKTTINRLKMEIRQKCPELIGTLEGKEAHIRLMAGIWAVLQFVRWFVGTAFVLLTLIAFGFLPFLHKSETIYSFIFICAFLLVGMWLANLRIEKLFHYRRVNELFHIVQAASISESVAAKKDDKELLQQFKDLQELISDFSDEEFLKG